MLSARLAGGLLYGKWLFTWMSLVMSLMVSCFVLSFCPPELLRVFLPTVVFVLCCVVILKKSPPVPLFTALIITVLRDGLPHYFFSMSFL